MYDYQFGILSLPQADNDLRKFLAMREQALSNRDPGSDQETAREASDDSERLERGPNTVQIFVHPCPCVYVLPKYLPPTARPRPS